MAKLKVAYVDGREVEINVGPRAEVALERQFDIAAQDATRNEHFYYLAYAALQFAGQEPQDKEFDSFLDEVATVEPVEAEKKAGPTRKAARTTA